LQCFSSCGCCASLGSLMCHCWNVNLEGSCSAVE
jgi:hypothetical protein